MSYTSLDLIDDAKSVLTHGGRTFKIVHDLRRKTTELWLSNRVGCRLPGEQTRVDAATLPLLDFLAQDANEYQIYKRVLAPRDPLQVR